MHTNRIAFTAAILFAAALLVFCACFPFMPKHESKNAAQPIQPSDASIILPTAGSETLFPDLGAVTSVIVSADSSRFDFLVDNRGAVSVNGKRADSEIFNTLIAQIAELPVHPQAAFSPKEPPVMTLTVRSGEREHVARFYEDDAAGEEAFILTGSSDAPRYRRTDGWRVGTMLMTCEGTRIQDERGNEPLPD
ncbi:MAG: hypothetical protein IJO02_01870 [Clostridia bacterium]|nr:hypothetical protein [Clostridia bacterium]